MRFFMPFSTRGAFALTRAAVASLALTGFVAVSTPAKAQLLTGFELPFVAGTINGQQGWTVSTVSSVPVNGFNISTTNPQTGLQSLLVTKSSTATAGTSVAAFSPLTGFTGTDASLTTVSLRIQGVTPGAAGGADYDILAQAPSQSLVAARLKFDYRGFISVLGSATTGAALSYINTGQAWTTGSYNTVSILVDASTNQRQYRFNNSVIYTDTITTGLATTVQQVVLVNDSFQVTGESANFDNLSVTRVGGAAAPEPGSLALVGTGVLPLVGAVVRRRRQQQRSNS